MRGRITALIVGMVAIVVYACTNDPTAGLAPKPPAATAPNYNASAHVATAQSGISITLLPPPPTYFVCQKNGGPYTGSALIGSAGGVLTFGPHKFTVPAGALSTTTKITATTVTGDTIAAVMGPSGLTFAKTATLSLDVRHCSNAPANDSSLTMVYVSNDLAQALATIQTILTQTVGQQLLGWIGHFSVYAVAEKR